MKIVSVTPSNVGPFLSGQEIELEPEVTVLTGANDTGKSALLRLIAMTCARSPDDVAGESDVNLYHLLKAKKPWDQDTDINCQVTFSNPDASYHCLLAPGVWSNGPFRKPGFSGPIGSVAHHLPEVIWIAKPSSDGIRQQISLNDPNPTEERFLRLAFGEFDFKALSKLSEINFYGAMASAEALLNQKLKSFLPATMDYRFHFGAPSDKREQLFVSLVDAYGGRTALGYRGSGVQKMVTLLAQIAVQNLGQSSLIILADEPETSLHADAQHTLRAALEGLGRLPAFQIVYATHSASMVNSMRPTSIRVLQRIAHGEEAYSVLTPDPFAGNYAMVRSSLGISPADSLLYAPVVLIVEGKTEVMSMPVLFRRLFEAHKEGFGDIENLLAQTIFLEAEGTGNISNLCRLAKAHGSHVIVFADGDCVANWQRQLAQHNDVPIITPGDGKEFEELIPRSDYFEALAAQAGKSAEELNEEAFDTWSAKTKLNPKLAFTKRVERWLNDKFETDLAKPSTMHSAVHSVDVDAIFAEPLRALLARVREAVSGHE